MDNYTYNKWKLGDFRLDTCSAVFPKGDKVITGINWDSINKNDRPKIKKKQEELFEKERDFFLTKLKDEFTLRSTNSKQKHLFLKNEYLKYKEILIGNIPIEYGGIHFEIAGTNTYFKGSDLIFYQTYFRDVYINGKERVYDFMNSPNYPYQDLKTKPNEIFAQALVEYFDFLVGIIKRIKEKAEEKKLKEASFEKLIDPLFIYSKSLTEFQKELQIDKKIFDNVKYLATLKQYKIQYAKAAAHYNQFEKDNETNKVYNDILHVIDTEIETILETIEKTESKSNKNNWEKEKTDNNFSHRQIAMAYCVMEITITKDNAQAILLKYSKLKSSIKLVQKRITQPKNLMIISKNKKANTDKLRDLNEAKRLISGTKNKSALTEITHIIKEFETILRYD